VVISSSSGGLKTAAGFLRPRGPECSAEAPWLRAYAIRSCRRPTAFVVHSGEHRVSRVILADSASDTVALGKMS
jgi:hypothetical protein